jgi:DNA-binding MarR family transcriptional regulator
MPLERTNRIALPDERRRSRIVRARRVAEPASAAHESVDVALDLLEQRRLTPTELRILLAVRHGERTESELAQRLGRRVMEVRPAAGALYARGLLQWRHLRGGSDSAFALTPAAKLALRPLLTALTVGPDRGRVAPASPEARRRETAP